MGFLDASTRRGQEKQGQAIVQEARKAGSRLIGRQEGGSRKGGGKTLGVALQAASIGGCVAADAWQFFRFRSRSGSLEHFLAQPYAGAFPLPGEHHGILPGSLPFPIVLEPGFLSPSWKTPGRPRFAERLGRDARLKGAAGQVAFRSNVGQGEISLDWAVQLLSRGDGTSRLVLQAGRYGGLSLTYGVGFSVFLSLVRALKPLLEDAVHPAHRPVHPIAFGEAFESMALEARPSPAPTDRTEDGFEVVEEIVPTEVGGHQIVDDRVVDQSRQARRTRRRPTPGRGRPRRRPR